MSLSQEPTPGTQIEWERPSHAPRRSPFGKLIPASRTKFDEALGTVPTRTTTFTAGSIYAVPALRARLDAFLSPHKTYLGLSRRTFLLAVGVGFVVILSLSLGLGLGLRHAGGAPENLPLPGNTGTFTGDLTYYSPGLGACGWTSTGDDMICAVSHTVFDAAATSGNPNANPLCGKRVRIVRDYFEIGAGNRSVDATVVDRCVGCGPRDLDLAPAVYDQLAPEVKGRVTGSWAWLN